ncbi:MAG: pyridine nucleotide-disulfide oxidoreductase, partial [bacterium]|nr:pyridine nucleotide-disulfide oxidoreductase [bacterium]
CIIEREERSGGILKQCIHDGFGLIRFGEKLTGPEYACRYIEMVKDKKIETCLNTFLLNMEKVNGGYMLTLVNSEDAVFQIKAGAAVLATGCRERTARQIFLHGTRPAGVITAGMAQYFINIQGYMPAKKCVILGSGDIGLIMARRLTLEGAQVQGVYEIKSEPSGLTRNIAQC